MKLRRTTKGWTLAELIVAIGLFALVMGIVSWVLIQTSRASAAQSQRSLRQASLQSCIRHIEKVLRRSPVAGLAWRQRATPPGAVLMAHALKEGMISSNSAAFEPYWQCLLWDGQGHELSLAQSVVSGGFDPAPVDRAKPMPSNQIDAIIAGELPLSHQLVRGRPLAQHVTDFLYAVEQGPLIRVELEIQVPKHDHDDSADIKERLRAVTRLHPRNRI